MAKLNIDQRTIEQLLTDKKADFLIPDYQRPYAWTIDDAETLWDDIVSFAIPGDNADNFDNDEEYYLGTIVTFRNDQDKLEVIDGQQRLTTIMLLLRAFYDKFTTAQDDRSTKTKRLLAQSLWKTDEFGEPLMDELKIDSEVATDDDKEAFLNILRTGKIEGKSLYAENYKYFIEKVNEFADKMPTYIAHLPNRILKNVIILPIEAENQNTALRIFSTLNDRGRPLADSDIFKAQLYQYYGDQKDIFIERWKKLEDTAISLFGREKGMDEIFTRYMYYRRAKLGIIDTTVKSLRLFFEENKYEKLRNEQVMDDLEFLIQFWQDVSDRNNERFAPEILRRLFILSLSPNGFWVFFVSVFVLHNKDNEDKLQQNLQEFLTKTIAYTFIFAFTNPGVNSLRGALFGEMVKITKDSPITFENRLINKDQFVQAFNNYYFSNQRGLTKSTLALYAFFNDNQSLIDKDSQLQIEHIYAKQRQKNDNGLSSDKKLEAIGNKVLLEKKINIRAAEFRFNDKKKFYEKSNIQEIRSVLLNMDDFTEENINYRSEEICNKFVQIGYEAKVFEK